ncbi:MAG: BNR repeat-containing protein [Clostridia bacterium]|nr:BNR repeat-containing protein [Clostridia bacterium]
MKKVLAIMLTICMVMAFVPAVSFAAETTVTAANTAFFTSSSTLSSLEGSSESGGSCVLVAWNHSDNWNAASTFTDTDGSVTNQTVTSGTAFGSSRQAVVSFNIPSDFDVDSVSKVTLGLTVRYIKQVDQAGARLAIYGNSIDGTWTTSTNKTAFGVSSSDSGTASLPLLGLTSPISMAGNNQVDEEVTLSSFALTDYVKEMAQEGKTQVTFRVAVPYGGVWIYNSTSAHPATLKIEDGAITSVNVKTVYMDGETEVQAESETVTNIVAGSEYVYTEKPASTKTVNDDIYVYSKEDSTLSVIAKADGTSEIVIVYQKYDDSQTFSGYEVDDEGAWCWFADPRSISYANEEGTLDFTIMGYIDVHGSIKATQINHLTDEVNEVLIRSNIQPDDHNNPTFIVLPDERVVVFYSRHTDENCFWYRVTKEPGDLTTLGEEKCLNTNHSTTYPSPFIMEDDPDHIYLMWRGVNWHPTCARLTMPDEEGNMAFDVQPFQVVSSTAQGSGCRPYAKYASDGKGKIYMTYTSTHPDNIYPVCIYYSCLDVTNFTLYDINGGVLKANVNTAGPFTVNGSETDSRFVVDPTSTSQRGWVWQIAISEDGKPVIAMVRINQAKNNHDYYYAKWNGSSWVKTFLDNGGTSFHQSTSAGLELCYSGGMAIDPDNTNVIYCSAPKEGAFGKVYEIVKYTMNDDGTLLSSEQITKNSLKNNVRPFVIPNSEGKDIRLVWMYGDYYDWIVSNAYTTQGFCTAVRAEAPLPEKYPAVYDWVASETYSDIGGAFVSTKETANVVEATVDGEFSVAAKLYLTGDYEGTLLDAGDVQLRIETMETQYGATVSGDRARVVVTVNGEDYVTSNVYGSSDCWVAYGRGTGGNYGVENYQGYVDHVLTFDGSYLTLYRDGLVDIKIPATNLSVDNVKVGGFDGQAKLTAVYDRVLNHDEIKLLEAMDYEVEVPDYEGEEAITKNYVDNKGNTIAPSEEIVLNKGSEVYNFVPAEMIKTDDSIYSLDSTEQNGNVYTAIYKKSHSIGENLIYNGDMSETTKEGNYTFVTGWQGGYVNSVHNPLSDRPYLSESGAWMATANAHFIYTPEADGEMAYVTTSAASSMNSNADYPWKSDVSEPYMGLVLTSWMKDASDVNSYLKAEKGKTYVMSFEMKATQINTAEWVNNVVGFDAVSENGDVYANKLPGTNGDISTLTSVLDNHIGRAKYLDTANEWVTIEAVATALDDGYFVFQLGWAHEWGQVSVRNFNVREAGTPMSISYTTEGDKLTVTPENIDAGVVVAVSVNNSESVKAQVYDGVNSLEFTVPETAEAVEVFVWKSIASMQPVIKKTVVK